MKKYETGRDAEEQVRKTIELPAKLVGDLEKDAQNKRMTIKAYLEMMIIEKARELKS